MIRPSSICQFFVDTYKTEKIPNKDILDLIKENFDFRLGVITINLHLKRGGNFKLQNTAAYTTHQFGWGEK